LTHAKIILDFQHPNPYIMVTVTMTPPLITEKDTIMKTILLSLLLSVGTIGACIPLFLLGVGLEMNSAGSGASFITVATWVVMALIAQPIVVAPYVLIRTAIRGAVRVVKG
jgi:hypothetical protein